MKLYFTAILSITFSILFAQEQIEESYLNQNSFEEFIQSTQQSTQTKSPRNLAIKLDSMVVLRLDTNTGQWTPGRIERYEYFHNGDIEFREILWIPYQRTTYHYDFGNRILQYFTEPMDSTQPVITSRTDVIYDSNNLRVIDSVYYKNSSGWYLSGLTKYTYDTLGLKLTKTKFNISGNNPTQSYKSEYLYNQNNQQVKESGFIWKTTYWDTNFVNEVTYNQNLNPSVYKFTNYINNQWDSIFMREYYYDANDNITQIKRYSGHTNTWILNAKYTYYYDLSYPGSDIWYPYFNTFNNKVLTRSFQQYYGGVWFPTIDTTQYYYSSAPVSVQETAMNDFKLYPNPVSNILKIEVPFNGVNKITILDMAGKTILIKKFTGSNHTLNVTNIPNGVYICKIANMNGVISKKIIIH